MKSVVAFVLLLLITNITNAQQSTLSWVNQHARSVDDLSFLSAELKGKTVVGLGEASHGTKEFYVQKRRMIEYLVQHARFRRLAIECPQAILAPVNDYLQSGEGNLAKLMEPMALYNTKEIYALFTWIREYNKVTEDRVILEGIDREDYWADPFTRDKLMAENVIRSYDRDKRKTIVWTHNVHVLKDTTNKYAALGYHLKQRFDTAFYAIGFDTYEGSVNVLQEGAFEAHRFSGIPTTFSGELAQAQLPVFFLSFTPDKGPLGDAPVMISNFYANWQGIKPLPVVPGRDVDALVFIRETTASEKAGE